MAESCKMISKQTAKSPSSSSSLLSLPLSPVISIFHLLFLSSLIPLSSQHSFSSACQTSITRFLSFPALIHVSSFSSVSVHPVICVAKVCICEQLVVQWNTGFWVDSVMQRCWSPIYFCCCCSVWAVRTHKEQKDWLMEIFRKQNSPKMCIVSSDLSYFWMLFSNVCHSLKR